MTTILVSWMLQLATLAGWGLLLQSILWPKRRVFGFATGLWFGWAGLIAFLQLWHLVAPVSGGCLGVVLAVAAAGWWRRGLDEVTANHRLARKTGWGRIGWVGLVLLGILVLLAVRTACKQILTYDTLLYHLHVVRWNNEHSIVPGLANLHSRLGIQTSFLLYAALWDNWGWDLRSAWLVPGLPAVLLWIQWLGALFLGRGRRASASRVYCLLTLPYVLLSFEWSSPTLYYDKAPLYAVLALGLMMVRTDLFRSRTAGASMAGEKGSEVADAAWMLAIAALSFSMKQSGAIVLALLFFGVLAAFWVRRGERKAGWFRNLLPDGFRVMGLATLLVAGYLVRNLVLSGWLLFPIPVLGFDLPWAYPEKDTRALYEVIRDWAKAPGGDEVHKVRDGFWAWYPDWLSGFRRSREYFVLLLTLGLAAVAGWRAAGCGPRPRLDWPRSTVFAWLILGGVLLVFWFLGAPDLRFGDGFFHLWLGLCGVAALGRGGSGRVAAGIAAIVALVLVGHSPPEILPSRAWLFSDLPKAKVLPIKQVSAPGTPTIWIPEDDGTTDKTGDAPLPAAPFLDPRLRLRDEDDLGRGFSLDESVDSPGASLLGPIDGK